jgi:hypothetical protein
MSVLQLKHESGYEASVALRQRWPCNALAVHVSSHLADPVQFDAENESSRY